MVVFMLGLVGVKLTRIGQFMLLLMTYIPHYNYLSKFDSQVHMYYDLLEMI